MTPKEACDKHLGDNDLAPKFIDKIINGKKERIIETYCNFFVQRVCKDLGITSFERLTANKISDLIFDSPDWTCIDSENAYHHSQLDGLTIAVLGGNPHGHVGIVYPAIKLYSGKWGQYVPQVAHAGKDGPKIQGTNYAFRDLPFFFLRKYL